MTLDLSSPDDLGELYVGLTTAIESHLSNMAGVEMGVTETTIHPEVLDFEVSAPVGTSKDEMVSLAMVNIEKRLHGIFDWPNLPPDYPMVNVELSSSTAKSWIDGDRQYFKGSTAVLYWYVTPAQA